MNEFVQPNHIPFCDDHPYLYATNDDLPRVWYKFRKSYFQMMKELMYEWVNGKSKATYERSLIKAHLTVGKGVSFLTWTKETNPSFLRKLEPIPKSSKGILV